MKSKTLLFAITIGITTLIPINSHAQIPVIDGANLVKNTAIFLKNVAMLKIMIENITKGAGDWEDATALLSELDLILKQGEALAYSAENITGVFQEKFPGYKLPHSLWAQRSETWTKTQLDTLKNVLESVSKQNQNFLEEQPFIESMLLKSNGAIGQMQALQQGNALVAANIKQLTKLRQLIMSQINADSVYRAGEISRKAESEAKGVSWASAAPRSLKPMSAKDSRGLGNFEFINPKR